MRVNAGRLNKAARQADPFILFSLQSKLYNDQAKAEGPAGQIYT